MNITVNLAKKSTPKPNNNRSVSELHTTTNRFSNVNHLSSRVAMPINEQKLRRKNEKLPLAIIVHYNFFVSLIFAVLWGRLVAHKHQHLFFCNNFQRALIIPVFVIWLLAEISRLYLGHKGILRDKLPELAAFLLLTVFPQVFTVLYLFLQEHVLPCDTAMGAILMAMLSIEIVLAWRHIRSIINLQTAVFYREDRLIDN